MKHYYTTMLTHVGNVTLQANDKGLTGVWFETQTTQPANLGTANAMHPVLVQAKQELQEYFAGTRQAFDVPIDAQGTDFQRTVWRALCTIPYGTTISYQQLADLIGNPRAVRAVGLANGKNPISVIVPCHRVIGKNGQLTGYAGGIERKQELLTLEGAAVVK